METIKDRLKKKNWSFKHYARVLDKDPSNLKKMINFNIGKLNSFLEPLGLKIKIVNK